MDKKSIILWGLIVFWLLFTGWIIGFLIGYGEAVDNLIPIYMGICG